jgi:hypothetical protein
VEALACTGADTAKPGALIGHLKPDLTIGGVDSNPHLTAPAGSP